MSGRWPSLLFAVKTQLDTPDGFGEMSRFCEVCRLLIVTERHSSQNDKLGLRSLVRGLWIVLLELVVTGQIFRSVRSHVVEMLNAGRSETVINGLMQDGVVIDISQRLWLLELSPKISGLALVVLWPQRVGV